VQSVDLATDAVPLRSLKQRQCALLANSFLFWTERQRLWLDRLYLRVTPYHTTTSRFQMRFIESDIWMTNVTVQGSGDSTSACADCGVSAMNSSTYVEGDVPPLAWHVFLNLVLCPLAGWFQTIDGPRNQSMAHMLPSVSCLHLALLNTCSPLLRPEITYTCSNVGMS
jgi:hypothetical protein